MAALREHGDCIGDMTLRQLRGGRGRPLVVLHDELGFPGWMRWNEDLADGFEQFVPLQPGFGDTPRVDWVRSYRDLAALYARWVRSCFSGPVDVIGFSAGGYIAAEMIAADPDLFQCVILVAPLGIKPEKGFIFDFLAVTVRNHLRATVARDDAPEFATIYGGEMTPEQFERFEDARAETARLGWEPFMVDPSLPHRLGAVSGVPALVVRGTEDEFLPRDAVVKYCDAIDGASLVEIDGAGHRPEIEDSDAFVAAARSFLEENIDSRRTGGNG